MAVWAGATYAKTDPSTKATATFGLVFEREDPADGVAIEGDDL
jgi:hypothetical protein